MQTRLLKIVSLLLIINLAFAPVFAQNPTGKLKKADSLFAAKQYTQSFDLYKDLFSSKLYSPSMLLKMAFIQEGLGHLSQSLYYLNLYGKLTHDSQTEEKIQELATKNNLQGYSDPYSQEKLMQLLQENRSTVTSALAAIVFLLLVLIFFQKRKSQQSPFALGILMVGFLALLFWLINFSELKPAGIIESGNTYVMEGPSSGASVLAIASEGHKLTIEGKYDVWLKVKWNDKVAFIKESNILPLNLN